MHDTSIHSTKIAVIGLGYVGLPVAVAFAAKGFDVLGFDINESRLNELRSGQDSTSSVDDADLQQETLVFSSNEKDLSDRDVLIVAVPTPVDHAKRPDLSPFRNAAATVGRNLKPGPSLSLNQPCIQGQPKRSLFPSSRRNRGCSSTGILPLVTRQSA